MPEQRKTSPWVYVAVGCGAAIVVGILALVAFGFFGYRWAKQVEREMKDPSSRAAKAMAVLGADELPAGYEPAVALSIPFAMDMVILSDIPVPEGEEPGDGGQLFEERGFMYFSMLSTGKQRREIDDFFEGRIDDAEFLRRSSISLQRGEVLARGEVDLGEAQARWIAQRGALGSHSGLGREAGLTTTVLVECGGDSRLRLGMWFGPDPRSGEGEAAEADFTGTVADEAALKAFLGHFRFCG